MHVGEKNEIQNAWRHGFGEKDESRETKLDFSVAIENT